MSHYLIFDVQIGVDFPQFKQEAVGGIDAVEGSSLDVEPVLQ